MIRFLPVAITALAALAFQARGSLGSSDSSLGDMSRQLIDIVPNGFAQVGQTLIGTADSVGTTTGTSDVEFGTVVAIADTGRRLAVGARRHDWNNGTVVNNAGGVFIYDLENPLGPSSNWVLKTSFVGNAGEQMGRWLAMSSDGSIIAIRRGNFGAAEVWRVETDGNKAQLGSGLTCNGVAGEGGAQLALSPDGQRLAMSCEYEGTFNHGTVKIFDWNNSTWVQVGTPLTAALSNSSVGLFGWDTAFSANGNRIAVSAPNFDAGILEQGLVRVFDFNATASTWNQVGQDLLGNITSQKFGFTMDMSSDGNTLVVGSPNGGVVTGINATNATGAVEVFTLTGGVWTSRYEFTGLGANDRFGRGIAVTHNGRQFVAASSDALDERGQILLFRLTGDTWSRTAAEFVGAAPGDHLAHNSMGVAMTDDGKYLAAGSVHAQINGIVQVFEALSTPSPSQAPTPQPSQAPLLSPSFAPFASSSPVNIVPDPEQFQWDIARVGNAEVAFSEDASSSEIIIHYNISLRDTRIQVFKDDCTTEVNSSVIELTSGLVATSTTHGNFTVNVDIKQEGVLGSSIWNDTGISEGSISMCIRVDLLLGDAETSVTFHEQKVYMTVSLLQGFEVTGIDLERTSATVENGDAEFDYFLTACQCNELFTCVNTTLTQGSDVFICVETTAPNVEIAQVRQVRFTQGTFNVTPVVDGVADALSEVTVDGKLARIRYQMISAFFEEANPDDVVANGLVLLSFTDDSGRRLLRSAKIVPWVPRALEEPPTNSGGNEEFKVRLALAASEDSSSATAIRGFASVVAVIGVLVVIF